MSIFDDPKNKKMSDLEIASYLVKKEEELKKKEDELEEETRKISGMSMEEARKMVLDKTEKELAGDISRKIKAAEETIKAEAQEKAKEILIDAIRHGVTDWVAEYTVSTIRLPDEEVKGRIIGREGRNIRAIEQCTGVELEIDETLDLRLSSFDSTKREIARLSLEKLIKDGRIQPDRIEEVVNQTKAEMDQTLFNEGKKIMAEVGVYALAPDLVKMIGKYKFRFSYGQNLALHTVEETKIGMALASELKADVNIVRLGCLLHDIGKVVTEEEGTHIELGVDLLKKYQIDEKVINCVAEHHEDKPFSSMESTIVWIADAASGSRPGARYEAHEEYLKRMTHIEETVRSFPEVADVAAYQAGREVRVIIKPETISDNDLPLLTRKIAEKLEEDAKYLGQIKVVAIRETRVTEVTK
jgi:ribonuclease Y